MEKIKTLLKSKNDDIYYFVYGNMYLKIRAETLNDILPLEKLY